MDFSALSAHIIYVVAFATLLGESGVFFLFFLPGDSLLFALGVLAASGKVSIVHLILILIVAAILGNLLGYFLGTLMRKGFLEGRKYLPKVKAEHLARAEVFYDKYGIYAVLFARFIPVIRTIVPFFAGVVGMRRKIFTLWTVIGGVVWVTTVTLVGYFFGEEFDLQRFEYLGIGVILVAAIATPIFFKLFKRFF